MPDSAIAETIAYEMGGISTAKRIVDAIPHKPVQLDSTSSLGSGQSKKPQQTAKKEPVNKRVETMSTKKFHEKAQQTAKKVNQNQQKADIKAQIKKSFERDL